MILELSKLQLNTVLTALDGQPRNPNSKDAALKRIGRHAEQLGISLDALLAAAAGLLDGRMDAVAFLAGLRDHAPVAADDAALPLANGTAVEPQPKPVTQQEEQASADPLAIPPFLRREPAPRPGSEPEAALVIPARRPARPARHDAAPAEGVVRKHREGTKEALVIELLRRPEGATIVQVMAATGWLAHTVRGAFAGALKRRGLVVISEKPEGGERVYRICT